MKTRLNACVGSLFWNADETPARPASPWSSGGPDETGAKLIRPGCRLRWVGEKAGIDAFGPLCWQPMLPAKGDLTTIKRLRPVAEHNGLRRALARRSSRCVAWPHTKGRWHMNPLQRSSWACAALLALCAGAQAQTPAGQAQLDLAADAACELKLSGKPMGSMSPGVHRTLVVTPGQVEVTCTGADKALAQAQEQVTLKAGETQVLRLRLRWVPVADGVLDNAGRLIWTRQDNGTDVDWEGAAAWCASLGQGWRLPSRAELESLTAGSA
ncbi:MAG: DUF1566 domain-containing protein, partial [Burkholderiales bacterium]